MLTLERESGLLCDGPYRFDPATRSWTEDASGGGEAVDPVSAIRWLQSETNYPLRVPVGAIGPREVTREQYALAEEIGAGLAAMGLTIICGGRQGIMEAVGKGATAKDGLVIGLLPGADATEANPYISVPIATGIGEARNALIARAAFCLVAIGNSHGTLSEVALGLQFSKTVFGIGGAPNLPEVRQFDETKGLLRAVACLVLSIPANAA